MLDSSIPKRGVIPRFEIYVFLVAEPPGNGDRLDVRTVDKESGLAKSQRLETSMANAIRATNPIAKAVHARQPWATRAVRKDATITPAIAIAQLWSRSILGAYESMFPRQIVNALPKLTEMAASDLKVMGRTTRSPGTQSAAARGPATPHPGQRRSRGIGVP